MTRREVVWTMLSLLVGAAAMVATVSMMGGSIGDAIAMGMLATAVAGSVGSLAQLSVRRAERRAYAAGYRDGVAAQRPSS